MVTCLQLNPKVLFQAKISLKHICRIVSRRQSKSPMHFYWNVQSLSMISIKGGDPLGVGCTSAQISISDLVHHHPNTRTASPIHRMAPSPGQSRWCWRELQSTLLLRKCCVRASETGAPPLFFSSDSFWRFHSVKERTYMRTSPKILTA